MVPGKQRRAWVRRKVREEFRQDAHKEEHVAFLIRHAEASLDNLRAQSSQLRASKRRLNDIA